jgi:hypothetical protein
MFDLGVFGVFIVEMLPKGLKIWWKEGPLRLVVGRIQIDQNFEVQKQQILLQIPKNEEKRVLLQGQLTESRHHPRNQEFLVLTRRIQPGFTLLTNLLVMYFKLQRHSSTS